MQAHENVVGKIIAYKLPKIETKTAYSLCRGYDSEKNSYIVLGENGENVYVHKDSFLHVQHANLKKRTYLLIKYDLGIDASERSIVATAKHIQNDLLNAIHSILVSENDTGEIYTICELLKALINHKPEAQIIYE